MDQAVLNVLAANGFDEKTSRAYLALLELGEGTVTDIARRAGLKRSIVYVILSRLQERGLASMVPGKKVHHYTAADPQRVFANVQSNLATLKQFLPVLRAMHNVRVGRPRIEIFEGTGGITSVYRSFELGKEARFLAAMARHEEHFPDEVKRWVRGLHAGVSPPTKNLVVDDAAGHRFQQALRGVPHVPVRFLARGIDINIDFGVVDDRVAITSFDPLYIVVIHHPAIARSLAVLFDLAWTQAGSRKK